ncbi:MAG: hypothetical protein Q7U85_08220 [Rhodocyclaceae bacterium]|nr:hypothetical protein [Rhodocyclaceae bacterium]
MSDRSVEITPQSRAPRRGWRVLGWLLLGAVLGAALVAAFLAYGQPELLLEQLNLRYCG